MLIENFKALNYFQTKAIVVNALIQKKGRKQISFFIKMIKMSEVNLEIKVTLYL